MPTPKIKYAAMTAFPRGSRTEMGVFWRRMVRAKPPDPSLLLRGWVADRGRGSPDFRSRPAAPAGRCFLFRLGIAAGLNPSQDRAALPFCGQGLVATDRDPIDVWRHADRRDGAGGTAGARALAWNLHQ